MTAKSKMRASEERGVVGCGMQVDRRPEPAICDAPRKFGTDPKPQDGRSLFCGRRWRAAGNAAMRYVAMRGASPVV